jgi:hypothetical protein
MKKLTPAQPIATTQEVTPALQFPTKPFSKLQRQAIANTVPSLRIADSDYKRVTVMDVGLVAQARINPIGDMDPMEAHGLISLAIGHVIRNYGVRKEVPVYVITECARVTLLEFSDFAIGEIVHAFVLKAAKRIEGQAFWGGQFDVGNYTDVLAHYRAYRYTIGQRLRKEENKINGTAYDAADMCGPGRKELRDWDRRTKLMDDFPSKINEAIRTGRYPKVRSVPIAWWDLAMICGMLPTFTFDEKREYGLRAERMVRHEFALKPPPFPMDDSQLASLIWIRAKQLIIFELLLHRDAS